jgi:hypothetical protein
MRRHIKPLNNILDPEKAEKVKKSDIKVKLPPKNSFFNSWVGRS